MSLYYDLLLRRYPDAANAEKAAEALRNLERDLKKAVEEFDPPAEERKEKTNH